VVVAVDEKAKPTHLEALRALRETIECNHVSSEHQWADKALARRSELEAAGQVEPCDSFDRMRMARARLSLLQSQAAAAERALEKAREAERKASTAREEAEASAINRGTRERLVEFDRF
jgi:multidrug efflux pump subunit AcrA (membrane-fusion protein)